MRRGAPQRGRVAKRRRTNNQFNRNQRQVVARRNVRTGGYVGQEKKWFDTSLTLSLLTTTGWVVKSPAAGCTNSISMPALGDGESDRNGRCFHITSLHVRASIEHASEEAATNPFTDVKVRFVIYWDKQTNAAVATGNDIMNNAAADNSMVYRDLENSKRFAVLYDKMIILRPDITAATTNSFTTNTKKYYINFNKNFKNPIKVQCLSGVSSANVTACADNNFNILCCADTANKINVSYQTRIRFMG